MQQTQSNSHLDRWRYLNELTDEQLVLALHGGEQDSLTVLFDRYNKLIFSIAMRIVNDPGEAEEVVQTVFLDFFRGLATFDRNKGNLKKTLVPTGVQISSRRSLGFPRPPPDL